jgi:hypothetical protein
MGAPTPIRSVRVVAISPMLPHLLAWVDDDPGNDKWGTQRTDDWQEGWRACERANNLPAAEPEPLSEEAGDGQS